MLDKSVLSTRFLKISFTYTSLLLAHALLAPSSFFLEGTLPVISDG